MTKFVFKARDREGKLVEGVKQSESTKEVVNALNTEGLVAVSVEEVKEKRSGKKTREKKEKTSNRRISARDIALFCRQMATMINAGVSIVEAVEDIAQMAINSKMKSILKTVANDIRRGSSFSEALKQHAGVFRKVFISMVRAGEESGNLDIVLRDLAEYLEEGVKLRRKVRSASTYPVFIAVFFILVVAGMVLFLIPKFKQLFASMGAELPLPTKIVMGLSDAAIKNIHWVILCAVAVAILFAMFYKTRAGRFKIDRLILRIPVFGMLITKVLLTRFFQTLSTLLRSGVDIVASLVIAAKVINNLPAESIIDNIRIKIMEGSNLAAEMDHHPLFPRMAVRMTAIGEKSGRIDEMLSKVAEFYSDEVDATVEGFSSIIEPFLIIFLGVIVGAFIISMYLPIFKMAMGMMTGGGSF